MRRYKSILTVVFFLIPIFAYADCDITVSTNNTVQGGFGHNSTHRRGQSFTPSCSGEITSIDFLSATYGSPGDSLQIGISASQGGTDLGNSSQITGSNFPDQGGGTCTSQNFTFSTPVSVTSGNTYFFTVYRSGSYSGTNWYYYCGAGTNNYGDGDGQYSNGSDVWSNDTGNDYASTIHIAESSSGITTSTSTSATTGGNQDQQNIFNAFVLFLASFALTVWLLRKH